MTLVISMSENYFLPDNLTASTPKGALRTSTLLNDSYGSFLFGRGTAETASISTALGASFQTAGQPSQETNASYTPDSSFNAACHRCGQNEWHTLFSPCGHGVCEPCMDFVHGMMCFCGVPISQVSPVEPATSTTYAHLAAPQLSFITFETALKNFPCYDLPRFAVAHDSAVVKIQSIPWDCTIQDIRLFIGSVGRLAITPLFESPIHIIMVRTHRLKY
jgi:hypothetical protein